MFRMLMYSLNIYCKGRGRLEGGGNLFDVNYEKFRFYFMAASTAWDSHFLSFSFKVDTFWIIYFCSLVRAFCNFSSLLSRKRMSRMNRLTSLGTSIIFYINSSRKTFPVWGGRLVMSENWPIYNTQDLFLNLRLIKKYAL